MSQKTKSDPLNLRLGEILPRKILFTPAVHPEAQRPPRHVHVAINSQQTKGQPQQQAKPAAKPNASTDGFIRPSFEIFPYQELRKLLEWKSAKPIGAGLRNLGNTCFLNATLQALTYTAPLINYLTSRRHSKECKVPEWCLLCELENCLPSFYNGSRQVLAPKVVVQKMRVISRTLRPGRQEDSHELLRFMMDLMQKNCLTTSKLKGLKEERVKETSFIHRLFGGYLRSQVRCCTCEFVSNTYEPFLDLSLEIRAMTLEQCLDHFMKEELLSGENKYACARCKKKVTATKRFSVYQAPTILMLHLKRFRYRMFGGKINKQIAFNQDLKLDPFMSDNQKSLIKNQAPGPRRPSQDVNVTYSLYAVLVHSGSTAQSGHYYSFVKSSADSWCLMDDSAVRQVSYKTVLNQEAYILFYVRNRLDENPSAKTSPILRAMSPAPSAAAPVHIPPLSLVPPSPSPKKSTQRTSSSSPRPFVRSRSVPAIRTQLKSEGRSLISPAQKSLPGGPSASGPKTPTQGGVSLLIRSMSTPRVLSPSPSPVPKETEKKKVQSNKRGSVSKNERVVAERALEDEKSQRQQQLDPPSSAEETEDQQEEGEKVDKEDEVPESPEESRNNSNEENNKEEDNNNENSNEEERKERDSEKPEDEKRGSKSPVVWREEKKTVRQVKVETKKRNFEPEKMVEKSQFGANIPHWGDKGAATDRSAQQFFSRVDDRIRDSKKRKKDEYDKEYDRGKQRKVKQPKNQLTDLRDVFDHISQKKQMNDRDPHKRDQSFTVTKQKRQRRDRNNNNNNNNNSNNNNYSHKGHRNNSDSHSHKGNYRKHNQFKQSFKGNKRKN